MILSCKLRTESGSINAITIYNFALVLWLPGEQMSQCEMFSEDSHSASCLTDSLDEAEVFNDGHWPPEDWLDCRVMVCPLPRTFTFQRSEEDL